MTRTDASRPGTGRPPRRTRRTRQTLRRLAGLAVALAVAAAVAGCGASGGGSSAAPQPPTVPGEDTSGPDLAGVNLPNFVMPLIKGGISRPDHALTPGNVTITDATTVCMLPTHGVRHPIPFAMQTAVYDEYGYTTPSQQHKYILDYLVPVDLGGAQDEANIWPAAVRGTGFYQKIETDHLLRQMVCRDQISLAEAQHVLETDWYSAWLRYVVATGHV